MQHSIKSPRRSRLQNIFGKIRKRKGSVPQNCLKEKKILYGSKAHRNVSTWFILPTKRTLNRMMQNFGFHAGLTIMFLKAQKLKWAI
jgi:hypothetical protein